MPKIRVSQLSPNLSAPVSNVQADAKSFGYAIGEGLTDFGEGITLYAKVVQDKKDKVDLLEAKRIEAEMKLASTQQHMDVIRNTPTDYQGDVYTEQQSIMKKRHDEIIRNYSGNKIISDYLTEASNDISLRFNASVLKAESDRTDKRAVTLLDKTINQYTSVLSVDPGQLGSVTQNVLSAIQQSELSESAKSTIASSIPGTLAMASMSGLINNAKNIDSVNKIMDEVNTSGDLQGVLSIEDRTKLNAYAEQKMANIRAEQVAAQADAEGRRIDELQRQMIGLMVAKEQGKNVTAEVSDLLTAGMMSSGKVGDFLFNQAGKLIGLLPKPEDDEAKKKAATDALIDQAKLIRAQYKANVTDYATTLSDITNLIENNKDNYEVLDIAADLLSSMSGKVKDNFKLNMVTDEVEISRSIMNGNLTGIEDRLQSFRKQYGATPEGQSKFLSLNEKLNGKTSESNPAVKMQIQATDFKRKALTGSVSPLSKDDKAGADASYQLYDKQRYWQMLQQDSGKAMSEILTEVRSVGMVAPEFVQDLNRAYNSNGEDRDIDRAVAANMLVKLYESGLVKLSEIHPNAEIYADLSTKGLPTQAIKDIINVYSSTPKEQLRERRSDALSEFNNLEVNDKILELGEISPWTSANSEMVKDSILYRVAKEAWLASYTSYQNEDAANEAMKRVITKFGGQTVFGMADVTTAYLPIEKKYTYPGASESDNQKWISQSLYQAASPLYRSTVENLGGRQLFVREKGVSSYGVISKEPKDAVKILQEDIENDILESIRAAEPDVKTLDKLFVTPQGSSGKYVISAIGSRENGESYTRTLVKDFIPDYTTTQWYRTKQEKALQEAQKAHKLKKAGY